jgi:hypothetical protein
MDFFSDDGSGEDDDEGEEYSAPPEILLNLFHLQQNVIYIILIEHDFTENKFQS